MGAEEDELSSEELIVAVEEEASSDDDGLTADCDDLAQEHRQNKAKPKADMMAFVFM